MSIIEWLARVCRKTIVMVMIGTLVGFILIKGLLTLERRSIHNEAKREYFQRNH